MRITGKHAAVYVGGIKVFDAYDCSVKLSTSMVNARAYGENFEQNVPMESSWTFTAKKYASVAYGQGQFMAWHGSQTATETPLRVVLYQSESTSASRVFEGDAYFEDSDFSAPHAGLVEETMSMRGADAPIFAAGVS